MRDTTGTHKKKHTRQQFQQAFFAQNDDAILADYVENMDSDYVMPDSSTSDDGSDSELEPDKKPMNKTRAYKQVSASRNPKGDTDFLDMVNIGLAKTEAKETQDNSADDDESDESEVSVSLSDLISYSQRQPPKGPRAKNMTKKLPRTNEYDAFLDYENFADFDIMDLERDSLHKNKKKNKKKGRKPDFDLSDSDLDMQLQATYERDRNKKKAKKNEREQLRAQGLLGKRSKLPVESMTMEEVKTQVKGFLLSSADTYVLKCLYTMHHTNYT